MEMLKAVILLLVLGSCRLSVSYSHNTAYCSYLSGINARMFNVLFLQHILNTSECWQGNMCLCGLLVTSHSDWLRYTCLRFVIDLNLYSDVGSREFAGSKLSGISISECELFCNTHRAKKNSKITVVDLSLATVVVVH